MRIRITAEVPISRGEVRRLRRSLGRMLRELLPGWDPELSLALVSEAEIARLNSSYLDREGPTDVLAFPQMSADEIESAEVRRSASEPLGDIVICVPIARRQAAEYDESDFEELELLAAHGLLHLVGFDDATDESAEAMSAMEMRLLGRTIIM